MFLLLRLAAQLPPRRPLLLGVSLCRWARLCPASVDRMEILKPEKAGSSRRIAKLLRTLPVLCCIAYNAIVITFMPCKAGSSRHIAKLLRTVPVVLEIAYTAGMMFFTPEKAGTSHGGSGISS